MNAYARRHSMSYAARRGMQARAASRASLARSYPRRPDRRPPDHGAERARIRARIALIYRRIWPIATP